MLNNNGFIYCSYIVLGKDPNDQWCQSQNYILRFSITRLLYMPYGISYINEVIHTHALFKDNIIADTTADVDSPYFVVLPLELAINEIHT